MMKLKICSIIFAIICCLTIQNSCRNIAKGKLSESNIELPERGLCAHRGDMGNYPENTLSAFREAVKVGAQMIEFDVFLTKDNEIVVIHDITVDRTTNGTGSVSDLTLEEIKQLDAGSWKAPGFAGERIPTLLETLSIMPINIWLNIHVKGDESLSVRVAEIIAKENRLHQSFLACSANAAKKARDIVPGILICNMDRKESDLDYVTETIEMKADFIQLRTTIYPGLAEYIKTLKEKGIRVNYYGTDSPEEIRKLFEYGVDFPLVNNIAKSITVAEELNIHRVKPVFASEK